MDTSPAETAASQIDQSAPSAVPRPIFPVWIWMIGIFLSAALVAIVWIYILYAPMPSHAQQALPLFTVYPAPTLSEVPPTSTWAPENSPTSAIPTSMPGMVALGMMVEVNGTGGDGLNLRDAPNTTGHVLFRVFEHEVFRVVDGPQQSNGYTWWLLQGAYDATRQGWGVENYLKPSGA